MTNYSDTIRIISGVLQLGVAWYALRLSRLCKSGRSGWLLFSALTLLALAYVLLPINPFRSSIHFAVRADIVIGLISTLLIAGMLHLEFRFRKQLESDAADRASQTQWQSKVGEQLEELNKTNDELRQTAASLQTQLGDTVRNSQQNEQMSRELMDSSRQTEVDLRETITQLEQQIVQLKDAQEKADAAHKVEVARMLETDAKMRETEIAAARQSAQADAVKAFAAELLSQAGENAVSLKSAQRATGELVRSRFASLLRVAKQLPDLAREIVMLCKRNPRAMHIQQQLLVTAQQLAAEQSHLLKKAIALDQLLSAVEAAARQRCADLSTKAGVAATDGEAAPLVFSRDMAPVPAEEAQLVADPTHTGTESVGTDTERFLPVEAAGDADGGEPADSAPTPVPFYLGGRLA